MTPSEHIAWAKERALEYVAAGDPNAALASIMSDLRKHPATEDHTAIELGMLLAFAGHLSTSQQLREWIEGIN